jgi:hypothetical protein
MTDEDRTMNQTDTPPVVSSPPPRGRGGRANPRT